MAWAGAVLYLLLFAAALTGIGILVRTAPPREDRTAPGAGPGEGS